MVKKLHSTQKSKGFFASESGENYGHCSVPLSQVTKQHSEVGIGAQLECRKMQGLNQGTRSFPDCKFPGNSRFAGNTSSLGFTVLSSQYTPIKILRDLSLILAKQHQIVINSKCFTSANLLFFSNSNGQLRFIALIWNIQQPPENVAYRNVPTSTTRSLFRNFRGTDYNEHFTVRTCRVFFSHKWFDNTISLIKWT